MSAGAWPILTAAIEHESDVVAVRQRARRLAELLGFEAQDQTRIATAVSEITRNAFGYAGGGRVEFALDGAAHPQVLVIRVVDSGPGIGDLDAILGGRYRSATGMGLGIVGARRLMDRFEIASVPRAGTAVTLGKVRPRQLPSLQGASLAALADRLARERADNPWSALREQNRELIRSLDELRERQEELQRLNRELEDTNRGVVALYAELDEKAEQLRQASELKSRFLSNMSHEFRTPLNSILALARLLLDRGDGDLTPEQERQVTYILRSAGGLTELVNDLLDLAKVEAGKVELRPSVFTAAELFSGLRGVLRPLRTSDAVDLVFEDVGGLPPLFTDESKVAQVLRNFVSNALKFTEQGEVRVSGREDRARGRIVLTVADTGIGIAAADQERVFEEFAQVDSAIQQRVKGTGLGLPLSRKLAELLGGEVWVESTPGAGSTFALALPVSEPDDAAGKPRRAEPGAGQVKRLLIVDDDEEARYLLRQLVPSLGGSLSYEVIEASNGREGLLLAREQHPDVVVLDLHMPGIDGYAVLDALVEGPATRDVPVIVSTSADLNADVRRRLKSAVAVLSKADLSKAVVASALRQAVEVRVGV